MTTHSTNTSRVARRAVLLIVAIAVVAAIAIRIAGGAALRSWAESTLNANLDGYRVALPELRIDVLGLGLQLHGATIRQEANAEPPIAHLERLGLTLSWRALLRGGVLAELEIESPRLHIDRSQVAEEVRDDEPLEDRGWQEALLAIYPLAIDRFRVDDGSLTYIESKGEPPLRLEGVELTAENIRNVRSPDDTYPSPVSLRATLFDSGRVRIDGDADLLASPYPAVDVDLELETVPLGAIDPLADEVDIRIHEGVLGANGHVEYGPDKKNVYINTVRIDGVRIDYVERQTDTEDQRRRAQLTEEAAETLSEDAPTRVYIDLMEVRGSELAYDRVDEYRLFVSGADITIEDVVNRDPEKRASLEARGQFMGAGKLSLDGSYRAGRETPDFDVDLRIEEMPLTKLNDVFRSHAKFDVSEGTFAFYSELSAEDARLDGYVKPILKNMDVYDRRQDSEKSMLGQAYEGVLGAVATILQNPSDKVAAKVAVSGRIDDPDISTWDAVLSLVRNAFVKAISPGLEDAGAIPNSDGGD
jgi:hypothetical protein